MKTHNNKLKRSDITIERSLSGNVIASAIHNGQYHKKIFVGYSDTLIKSMFCKEVNQKHK